MAWQDWVLGGLTGSGVILVLSSWLGKVWANRILEKDRIHFQTKMETLLEDLRTQDRKELFVHQLQFEKEFDVYIRLWKAVLKLKEAATAFKIIKMSLPKEAVHIVQTFMDAYINVNEIIYNYRPFYSPNVFDKSEQILNHAKKVYLALEKRKPLDKAPFDLKKSTDRLKKIVQEIECSLDRINDSIILLCDVMRSRVWSTGQSGWDRRP